MQDFRRLDVWHKAHAMVLSVYRHTRTFPREEMFGLTSQMRRAATSVAANIAEGSSRGTDKDFARVLIVALGSASELEYYVVLGSDLEMLSGSASVQLMSSVTEVKRMLNALITKLGRRRFGQP